MQVSDEKVNIDDDIVCDTNPGHHVFNNECPSIQHLTPPEEPANGEEVHVKQ